MEIVLLAARLLLVLVFSVAGMAKATDLAGFRRTLIDFGVPERLATPLAQGLPIFEIIIALALIPLSIAWWSAMAALALLLIFAAGIGANLARGQAPNCNCFGQLQSKPVSWSTFTRNLMLAAIAGFIVTFGKNNPGSSALNWLTDLKTAEIVNLVLGVVGITLLATAVIFLRRMLRQQGKILERIEALKAALEEDIEPAPIEREDALPPEEGLPVGAPAPAFSLPTIDGHQISLDDLLEYGKPALLFFVSPNCSPCKTLLPMIQAWERDYGDQITFTILGKGTLEENQRKIAKYEIAHLLLSEHSTVADDYQAKWTPAAILINSEGRIASHTTYGDEAIRALVNHTIATGTGQPEKLVVNGHRPQITVGNSLFKIGELAPRFSLPNLEGTEIGMEQFLGRDTLLLFWNTQCGFCQAMTEDWHRWEENPPKGAPRLVFIASGSIEETKAANQNFKSVTLLDAEFDVGPMFGVSGTPSAVLIDSEGKIASSLAVGAKNILALAGVRRMELPIASGF